MKRNRIPVTYLQFTKPNLIAIVKEIESFHVD